MSWIIKAANRLTFSTQATVKVTVTLDDIAKRPEIERISSSDATPEEKVRMAQEAAPTVFREVVADKIHGINEYAASQGIVMIAGESIDPETGDIDWNALFQRPTGPKSIRGENTPNESEEEEK